MNNIEKCCCTEYIEKDDMLRVSFTNETYSIYGNLNKGDKIILKYFGKLITNESEKDIKVFLNYGYGNLWMYKNVIEMTLCCHSDNACYCAELELLNVENLFFCFMDNNNNWDLNENSSYMVTIEAPPTVLIKTSFAVAIHEEEFMSTTGKFIKQIINKLIHFFDKLGGIFDKKVKS